MEFIERNFIITTGAMTVDSNTSAAANLYSWDKRYQYVSDGFEDDATSTTITYSFYETTTIDRIALVEHNLKDYSIYYDGTTTNLFNFTTTAATTTSEFTSNSETSQYFRCTQVACTSVSLKMNATQTADTEKAVGIFVLSSLRYEFARIPAAKGYLPRLIPKQVVHKMSDGGVRRHRLTEKWQVYLRFSDIEAAQRDAFREIFDEGNSVIFTAFGTSTSWDGVIFDAVYDSDFDFYRYAENSTTQNYKGRMRLRERS